MLMVLLVRRAEASCQAVCDVNATISCQGEFECTSSPTEIECDGRAKICKKKDCSDCSDDGVEIRKLSCGCLGVECFCTVRMNNDGCGGLIYEWDYSGDGQHGWLYEQGPLAEVVFSNACPPNSQYHHTIGVKVIDSCGREDRAWADLRTDCNGGEDGFGEGPM